MLEVNRRTITNKYLTLKQVEYVCEREFERMWEERTLRGRIRKWYRKVFKKFNLKIVSRRFYKNRFENMEEY